MHLFVLFSVLISHLLNGCVSEKHVLFIHYSKGASEYHEEDLSRDVEQKATQIFEEESDFNFKVIHPNEHNIVKATKSKNENFLKNPTSQNDFHTKKQSILLQNLQTLLQNLTSNSVIYVITDDLHPSDQHVVHEVLETIQIKRTVVNFILNYAHSKHNIPKEYRLISFVSNGLIAQYSTIEMDHFKNNTEHLHYEQMYHISPKKPKFTDSMQRWLTVELKKLNRIVHQYEDFVHNSSKFASQKVTIKSVRLDSEYPCFALDLNITEAKAMNKDDIKEVEIITGCIQFDWDVTPQNQSIYSLRVTARSELNFIYGFSTDQTDFPNQMYIRPIKDKSNRIYISSNNQTLPTQFSNFDIILKNGSRLRGTHLQPVRNDTNLFVGNFEPPNEEYFYILVNFSVNGRPGVRMSSNAINAANDFGEDKNNPLIRISSNTSNAINSPNVTNSFNGTIPGVNPPKSEPHGIPWERYLLIFIIICVILILGEIVWIIRTYKKSPELPPTPLEIEKPHPRAASNFYLPVSYNTQNQNVEII